MATAKGKEPELLIPALAGFYDHARDWAWVVVRVTMGGILLTHGIGKLMGTQTVAAFAAGSMARRGIEPALAFAYAAWFLETVGATCLILGLFTRFFAAAIAIEFAFIAFVASWPNGWGWSRPGGGWEFGFLFGLIVFAISLRGGGPFSLDRVIGKEL